MNERNINPRIKRRAISGVGAPSGIAYTAIKVAAVNVIMAKSHLDIFNILPSTL